MPIYEIPLPANYDPVEHDAGAVQSYLQSKGIAVESVSITQTHAIIDASTNPLPVLAAYSPPPTQRQLAGQALTAFNAINLNTATTAQLRESLNYVRVCLNYLAKLV